jgi:DNA polymerase phi
MLPLVDLITGTGADEKQLADKASGILRSRFGKSKEVPTGVDKEQTVTVLEEIHSRSRRASNQDVLATLSQCSLYLTRVLLGAAKDAIIATYKKSLEDFATRKASSFNGNFFQDFAKRHPAQAWDLRSDAVELASRSVNAYRKCQVFQVVHVLLSQASTIVRLRILVENKRLIPAQDGFDEQFVKFIPSLRDALLATLTPTGQDASLNAAQAKELLKLASQAVRQSKRVTASSLSTLWKPDAWEELRSQLASSDRFKASTGLLNACKQIVELASGSSSSSAKIVSDITKHVSSKVAEKKAAKLGKRKADDSGAKQVGGKTKSKKVKKA